MFDDLDLTSITDGRTRELVVRLLNLIEALAATTRKLRVNFYYYIHHRISGGNQIPRLSSLIEERARKLNLGASREAA